VLPGYSRSASGQDGPDTLSVVNYLSHARHHLDRPYALAGTSLPDWMRFLGREFRVDPKALPGSDAPQGSVAADLREGVLCHFKDDAWFHADATFKALMRVATDAMRARYPDPIPGPRPRRLRAHFFAHILVELLLDAWLAAEIPDALDRYYNALDQLDGDAVRAFIAPAVAGNPEALPKVLEGFRKHPFLRTYGDDQELSDRLSGVAKRVALPPMPEDFAEVVAWMRPRVEAEGERLLRL